MDIIFTKKKKVFFSHVRSRSFVSLPKGSMCMYICIYIYLNGKMFAFIHLSFSFAFFFVFCMSNLIFVLFNHRSDLAGLNVLSKEKNYLQPC